VVAVRTVDWTPMSRGPARVWGSDGHLELDPNAQMIMSGTDGMDQKADGPGLVGRYIRVFISPDMLFQALRRRTVWAGAMLMESCLMLAGTVLMLPELTIATLRERALEKGRAFPPRLADRMELLRFADAAGAFIFWALLLTIFAGLVTLFFAFLVGHQRTFLQYLAVVVHVHLISATSTVLLLPLRIVAEDAQVLLSLGSFAVFLEPGYLLQFLSFLDLSGLGVARICRKESWAGGVVIVMIIPVTMAAVIAIFAG
jgi:hypothetical protein